MTRIRIISKKRGTYIVNRVILELKKWPNQTIAKKLVNDLKKAAEYGSITALFLLAEGAACKDPESTYSRLFLNESMLLSFLKEIYKKVQLLLRFNPHLITKLEREMALEKIILLADIYSGKIKYYPKNNTNSRYANDCSFFTKNGHSIATKFALNYEKSIEILEFAEKFSKTFNLYITTRLSEYYRGEKNKIYKNLKKLTNLQTKLEKYQTENCQPSSSDYSNLTELIQKNNQVLHPILYAILKLRR